MMALARPNLLYLHSHDTGRYIQPYGYPVPTPNLQRLAEEGFLFRQAFCANPTCSASRAALLTGQCAHSSGMTGLAHRGFSLKDYGQHLVHTLRAAGYVSTLVGVQHVARDATVIGYDEILRTGGKSVRE
ncbi:MAG: sulfatase-like hydrolase/transferase, partial [Armatimonadota bacterium]|nr:sulfatase-like hydrolase/transferase [Armatimonadota bacterium]